MGYLATGNPDICGAGLDNCVCDVAHATCIDTDDPRDGVYIRPLTTADGALGECPLHTQLGLFRASQQGLRTRSSGARRD